MKRFTVHHELVCSREAMWKAFLATPQIESLHRDLEFPKYEVVELHDTETAIVRRAFGIPKLNLPAAVSKLLGANFGYTEEGTFNKATEVWTFKMIPSTLPDKLRHDGTMRLEEMGPAKVRRVVELELDARIFGIAGLIESAFEKQLREIWDKSAVATNAYFRALK